MTFWVFLGMAIAVLGVLQFLPQDNGAGNFWGFFFCFMALFFLTGVGNASTFQMIPSIMQQEIPPAPSRHRRGRHASASRDGRRGHHRVHKRDRRLWSLFHPQGLRHVDQHNRRASGSALVLPDILCGLRGHHVGLLHAQECTGPMLSSRQNATPDHARMTSGEMT